MHDDPISIRMAAYQDLARFTHNALKTCDQAALDAFHLLQAADPELTDLTLQLFQAEQSAASYLFNRQLDYHEDNAYACLAAGGREQVVQALNRIIYGLAL